MNQKKQYVDVYEQLNAQNDIIPTFEVYNLQYNESNRYLTSHEVRQIQNHQTITALGLCPNKLDEDITQKAIQYIGQRYKFLTSSIIKTDDGKWYHYQMRPEQALKLNINHLTIINDIEKQFQNYDTISVDNLFTIELYQADFKQQANQREIKSVLVMQVHHCLMDAQNLIALVKTFNNFYQQLKNELKVQLDDFTQLSPFRPIHALIDKLNVKQIAEQLMQTDGNTQKPQIGKITNKQSKLNQFDMVNNILHENDCNLRDFKLQKYNLTSLIYSAVGVIFYQKALQEETIKSDETQLLILADIKNIRKELQSYLSILSNDKILGSFFIPNFIPFQINGNMTLQSLIQAVYHQQSSEMAKQKFIGTIIKCDYNKLQKNSQLDVNIMVSNLGKIDLGSRSPVEDVIMLSTEIMKNSVHNGIAMLINQCQDTLVISQDDLGYFSYDEQHKMCSDIIKILQIIKSSENSLDTVTINDVINQLTNK